MFTRDLCYDINMNCDHFRCSRSFSGMRSKLVCVRCIVRDPVWNSIFEWASGYSVPATYAYTHVRLKTRVTADSCSAMSESEIQICGLERHPEHQSTSSQHHWTGGGDPIQTEQMGHAVELQNRPSAPLSSSDPNTNWHLINILSEGFISLTSRCLFFFSLRKTIDALITQNSICERERPATHAHRLKWAVQKWMNAHFIPLRKEVFFILQAFLSLLI